MTDLSRVVSFFAVVEDRPGSSGRRVLVFRGPGRLPAGAGAGGLDGLSVGGALLWWFSEDGGGTGSSDVGAETSVSSSDCHTGHFFASGESSGTSTTSVTFSPAKRYRLHTLIIFLFTAGSAVGELHSFAEAWKLSQRAFFLSSSSSALRSETSARTRLDSGCSSSEDGDSSSDTLKGIKCYCAFRETGTYTDRPHGVGHNLSRSPSRILISASVSGLTCAEDREGSIKTAVRNG